MALRAAAASAAVPTPNAALVARLRAGDGAAAGELVRRFGRGVSVILRHLAHEPAALGDLYQESLRLIVDRIRAGEPRDPDGLNGFVAGVARHLALERFLRPARRRTEGAGTTERFADPGPSPLDALLDRERAALARRTLEGLASDHDREVLYRFYLVEEDADVICSQLALTTLDFNRVLQRARRRYRELFEGQARPAPVRG